MPSSSTPVPTTPNGVTDHASPTFLRRRASTSIIHTSTGRVSDSSNHTDESEELARLADLANKRKASVRKRRRDDDVDDSRVLVGTKIDEAHANYMTAYNMLTGIRVGVSRTNAKIKKELTDADFQARHKYTFDMTGNELTPSAKYDFKFKDYAPNVFRDLRSLFHLDAADYLMSLTSKYILSEIGSPGKSGSFFYYSRDYRYIIKTIHKSEHRVLRKILKDYYNHVKQYPNTLISQFYGLHRVKMAFGRKIHFVVMNNLFPPHRDIHVTYDLKGSTVGRDTREGKLLHDPRATLKDLNWIRKGATLELGPSKRDLFLQQLQSDVGLLAKMNIMDYSLLLGIHDVAKGNRENIRDSTLQVFQPNSSPPELVRVPSKRDGRANLRRIIMSTDPVSLDRAANHLPSEDFLERRRFVFHSDDGGLRATNELDQPCNYVYYLGIIDCLTNYGLRKRLEHFFKSFTQPVLQISAVKPKYYADRFLNFMSVMVKPTSKEARLIPQTSMSPQAVEFEAALEPEEEKILIQAQKRADKEKKPGDPPEEEKVQHTLRTVASPPNNTQTTASHPGPQSSFPQQADTLLPVVEEDASDGSITGAPTKSE